MTRRALQVQTSAGMLLWAARARRVLGLPHEAIQLLNQALPILHDVGDRAGEAATLNNIGLVDVTGDGKADAVVFFPGDGSWYVAPSLGGSFGGYTRWTVGHGAGS